MMTSAAAKVQGVEQRRTALPSGRAQIRVPSAEEGIRISYIDAKAIEWFGKDSPVIPVGVFTTGLVLMSGLVSFNFANKAMQQNFMRARVVTQGLTIAAMMTSLAVQERQKTLGLL
eukprot:CAMPEP_0184288698 /NCGR_PEP_ID=MMETSP1049-20130417/1167_1 /TAXON_ID=77928 /ORGANISM="Proteomonas sulcata, Strain CCMP704" /LENGTH=115 /DNA_ID=CAMNT_0026595197 /DNA_START=185 /DNA_END=532 /DNA_ORIENTATION=-